MSPWTRLLQLNSLAVHLLVARVMQQDLVRRYFPSTFAPFNKVVDVEFANFEWLFANQAFALLRHP
ncbi:MAG: hypothetical protein JWR40_4442 [Massilia sp.]|nr:hypothetical protein [Massilia sp.]